MYNYNLLILALIGFLFSILASYFITPFIINFAHKIGIVDDPNTNKHPKVIHSVPTPRGGGMAVYLAILISTLLFLPIDKYMAAILLGATVLVIQGVLDDKYNIHPIIRLAIGFFAAAIPIAAGIGIPFIKLPVLANLLAHTPFIGDFLHIDMTRDIIELSHPQLQFYLLGENRSIWILADLFGLMWIVFMMNMLNMGAKGLPGQLPGISAIAALTIAALSFKFQTDSSQWPVAIFAAIIGGAFIGFLPYNFFPQKIMPSYSGATLAGYLLGILSILSTTKVGILFVVLSIPAVDTGFTIFRRIATGKSPIWGDRGHLHHKLLDSGLTQKQVVLLYWTASAILGIASLYLNSTLKFYTIIGVSVFVGFSLIWLKILIKRRSG